MSFKVLFLIRLFVIILLFNVLLLTHVFGQDIHSKDSILIKIDLVELNQPIDLTASLHSDNQLVFEQSIEQERFELLIPVHQTCTLVISEADFVNKCIVFDFNSEESEQYNNVFVMQIDPVTKNEYKRGEDSFEFPVGIVRFDDQQKQLKYRELYSDHIWKMYTAALNN